MQQTELQALHARVQAIEEREANRSKQTAEASPEATPPSQRRSSVASTELLQPEHVLTAPASYPVDAIMESQHCHLMTRWENFKVKAAVGSVRPPEPGATFHYRSIPEGFARMKGSRSQQSRAMANRLNLSGPRKHFLLSAGFLLGT